VSARYAVWSGGGVLLQVRPDPSPRATCSQHSLRNAVSKSLLKVEAVGFPEASVYMCVATRRHKQDESNHSHRSENLKTLPLLLL
jgi:hypothetical protein